MQGYTQSFVMLSIDVIDYEVFLLKASGKEDFSLKVISLGDVTNPLPLLMKMQRYRRLFLIFILVMKGSKFCYRQLVMGDQPKPFYGGVCT